MPEPTRRGRPHAPGYGIRPDASGMLPWSFVEERMSAAPNYWVATVRPDGRPHLTPVWGLWVEGVFYFGCGPQTVKARNLSSNPNVSVHLEGEDVVILEGTAEPITNPDPELSGRILAASTAKYGMSSGDIEGSYAVRPSVVLAWTGSDLLETATRWAFD